MDGWLGILVFGALFFLMMRFGCGAHMMRGHGKEAGGAHAGHGGCCGGHEPAGKEPSAGDRDPAAQRGPAHPEPTGEGGKP